MKIGIGYGDNPDSDAAGLLAAKTAFVNGGRPDPCDFVLLFSTSTHDYKILRAAVSSVVGEKVPIYGGGAVGVITNDYFGYSGDQVAAACVWLDGVGCEILIENDLHKGEREAGLRLGRRLSEIGTKPDSPVMMFYDTFDFSEDVRMMMATWLLDGIFDGLGFVPNLTGAGMIGNHMPVPVKQWTGDGIGVNKAIAIAFSGDIKMDSAIMHGCRPATGYFTVTKSAGQVILEINGMPAIDFIDELLGSAIAPEQYPFFLIFGINHGERWGEYDEDYYASRLCLSIDKESGGIVMFEPDMVEGTEFQLMIRSMDLAYIKPKIEKIFNEAEGREPVFAMYINCAGRCAGYGGRDIEDAVAVQEAVAGRVPMLGMYSGVEIAKIGGRPRGLDWTGVFCLFTRESKDKTSVNKKLSEAPVWNGSPAPAESAEARSEALARLSEQNAAKYLELDLKSIAIRHELELKRRGFSLLSELSFSLRQKADYENIFASASKRINAALNMKRTAVLINSGTGSFTAEVLQGYSAEQKLELAGKRITLPPELLDPDNPVIVTAAEPADLYADLRKLLDISYFISTPVILQGEVCAVLVTGRMIEAGMYQTRLSRSDMETVHAVGSLLASVVSERKLSDAEERNRIMIDAMPVSCVFFNENGELTDCNSATLSIFGMQSKIDFIKNYGMFSPELQPDGSVSKIQIKENIKKAFLTGKMKFKWVCETAGGEPFPAEIALIRMPKGENYILAGIIDDLREQEAAAAKMSEAKELVERHIKFKSDFLASVSHEIRTPMNSIQTMARIAGELAAADKRRQKLINQGMHSAKLLTSAIETVLDFSKLDSGELSLEKKEFSVRELIKAVASIVRKDAFAKSLTVQTFVGPEVPDALLGDSARIRQALFNIVINAVKFTETGGVEITVSNEETADENAALIVFVVRDTGIGITEKQMANIYSPLVSGNMSYSRKQSGLGMGLAISNGLVALMGGAIECESREGEGSAFTIKLPLSIKRDEIIEAEEAPAKYNTEALRGLRVLVAEDNNINQMIMEEILKDAGIEVTIASNGVEAIKLLDKNEFDLVLMDIQMPEMDGLTATEQIRKDKRFAKLPILAMTANAGPEYYAESISAGMNDHLTKPVDFEELYDALAKWCKK